MAESDLSAEVNATTVLPSASDVTASYASGSISLSWTNNDDSSDGGIDVERSSDGGATWSDVITGLAPSTTSYDDSSVTAGESYQYRIERNTDHATATSSQSGTIQTLNQIGTARIDKAGTTLDVPVYSTDTVSETWLRVELSDGTVGALRPVAKSGEPLRAEKDGTVHGIETKQS
ncbi:hypothetical protein [Halovenus marina]|uniref:hypothetical protein n=1 Tax=Halovenus marina TaxID=3396621 RepID=UPI003F549892